MGLKKSNAMLMMGLLPLMMSGHAIDFTPNKWTETIPKKPKDVQPKNTKEYFFNQLGEYSTEHMRKDECVYKCFAINYKNAKRKFDAWKLAQQP